MLLKYGNLKMEKIVFYLALFFNIVVLINDIIYYLTPKNYVVSYKTL